MGVTRSAPGRRLTISGRGKRNVGPHRNLQHIATAREKEWEIGWLTVRHEICIRQRELSAVGQATLLSDDRMMRDASQVVSSQTIAQSMVLPPPPPPPLV
jgi:hypothetical protein